jgi:hypothetical protein
MQGNTLNGTGACTKSGQAAAVDVLMRSTRMRENTGPLATGGRKNRLRLLDECLHQLARVAVPNERGALT